MKIGMIGSGNVGSALAGGWIKAGHDICFGSREPNGEKMKALLKQLGVHACAETPPVAARWGEVVVLATPYHAAQSIVQSLGDLGGKVLIDSTNPLGSKMELVVGYTTSAAEQIAGWARNARVVKAYNITGAGNSANPNYPGGKALMLFCGDDADARSVVSRLTSDLGLDWIDFGPLSNARLLEPLGGIWVTLAYKQGFGPNMAFGLLKR
jgi:8-hydroxy-5-deazaflavin:NADPH oxidoreductase